jgi:hypothetical protein
MNRAFELARAYGVRVELADLGDWGSSELHSEYDPAGPVIRINRRSVEPLEAEEIEPFLAFSIGHELYHHREYLGEVGRLRRCRERESAADDFARSLLE